MNVYWKKKKYYNHIQWLLQLYEQIGIEKIIELAYNYFKDEEMNKLNFKKSMRYVIKRIYMEYNDIIPYKHTNNNPATLIKKTNIKKIDFNKYSFLEQCLKNKYGFQKIKVNNKDIEVNKNKDEKSMKKTLFKQKV